MDEHLSIPEYIPTISESSSCLFESNELTVNIHLDPNVTEFRKKIDFTLENSRWLYSFYTLDTIQLPSDCRILDREDNPVDFDNTIVPLNKIYKVEFSGQTYRKFVDAWGNPFFSIDKKVENKELKEIAKVISNIWLHAGKGSDFLINYLNQNLKEAPILLDAMEWAKKYPALLKPGTESLDLEYLAKIHNESQMNLELAKYFQSNILGNDESTMMIREKIEELAKKTHRHEDKTENDQSLILCLRHLHVINKSDIHLGSKSQFPLVIDDLSYESVLASFTEDYLLKNTPQVQKILQEHQESITYLKSLFHPNEIPTWITNYNQTNIIFAFPNITNLKGKSFILYLTEENLRQGSLLLNHENVHRMDRKARELRKTATSKDNSIHCLEGHTEALAYLLTYRGNIDQAKKSLKEFNSGYSTAALTIIEMIEELSVQDTTIHPVKILVDSFQKISEGKSDNILSTLGLEYINQFSEEQYKNKLKVFDDTTRPISTNNTTYTPQNTKTDESAEFINSFIDTLDTREFWELIEKEYDNEYDKNAKIALKATISKGWILGFLETQEIEYKTKGALGIWLKKQILENPNTRYAIKMILREKMLARGEYIQHIYS